MSVQQPNTFRSGPDEQGHFGMFGGRFVAETLMPLILDLEKAYAAAKADPAFRSEMDGHLKNYVATATLCARFGLECIVYMGAVDVARQAPNVFRMEMLGAKVVAVQSGTRTLKDAMNEALRDWVTNVHNTFYCIGTVAGPHPYPMMVRDFQSVIGDETKVQMREAEGRLPDSLVACIGGGSNAM